MAPGAAKNNVGQKKKRFFSYMNDVQSVATGDRRHV